MIVAAEVAGRLGRLSEVDVQLHHRLLKRNGLTALLPPGVTVAAAMALLRMDNKRGYVSASPDQVAMILLAGPGIPCGPADRPLTLVDLSLVQSCIEAHLTGGANVALEESRL
jgi:hypothetical protein